MYSFSLKITLIHKALVDQLKIILGFYTCVFWYCSLIQQIFYNFENLNEDDDIISFIKIHLQVSFLMNISLLIFYFIFE